MPHPEKQLEGIDAFVNLAGESINNGRWTEEQKQKIYDSRMQATDELLRILKALNCKTESTSKCKCNWHLSSLD